MKSNRVFARLLALIVTFTALVGVAPAVTPEAEAVPQCTRFIVNVGRYVPASSAGSTSCTMGQGAVSDAVLVLQFAMAYCHGQSLSIDGIFGPDTRRKLVNVQRNVGAAPDGVYGPETYAKMSRRGGWPNAISGAIGCIVLV